MTSTRITASLASLALAAAILIVVPAHAETAGGPTARASAPSPRQATAPGSLDRRRPLGSARARMLATERGRAAIAPALGRQAVFDLDPRTGTVRTVGDLRGTLTPPSHRAAASVAMTWVRHNAAALGLAPADLRTFRLERDYVDIDGTHHLAWVQVRDGVEAFDNGLLAAVTADGRLVTVSGSPAHGLGRGATTTPTLSRGQAIGRARRDLGAPAARRTGDHASLVYFHGGRSTLAYETFTTTAAGQSVTVIDATTGAALWRADLSHDATGTGLAWGYYPSNQVPNNGGIAQPVTFPVASGNKLTGNNAHVFLDPKPDFRPDPTDEIHAISGLDWTKAAVLNTTLASQNCSPAHACTWNPGVADSWKKNRLQDAVQAYWFVNTFHDHLLSSPIGFTEAAGNFQTTNGTGHGKGHDAVRVHVFLGAASGNGRPLAFFTNNASMGTPPDGKAPNMFLLLFRKAHHGLGSWVASDAAVDASIVYHEYTHGLSSRLVTYPNGLQALNTEQSGAMGEAWSDWYALDALENDGYITDTATSGEVREGQWITGGKGIRTQGIDCPVGASSTVCPDGFHTTSGGFTYGDYGEIAGGPEVHADGEIWAQTLWDLRNALGSSTTEGLVTRAMELSPPDPSFLDMRNAILQADVVANGGANATAMWNVFRDRGMGYFASTADGNDTHPTQNGAAPPDCAVDPCGSLVGRVTTAYTGGPVKGVHVWIGGHGNGEPGVNLSAVTDGTGHFAIANVPFHRYPDVVADGAALEPFVVHGVKVDGVAHLHARMYRDWAARDGGARIASFTKPNYAAFDCGPPKAIDRSPAFGWGSDAPHSTVGSRVTGPRSIVIELPRQIDVHGYALDPSPACGDPTNTAVNAFTISTKAGPHARWIEIAVAHGFPLGRLSARTVAGPGTHGVRLVRFTMRTNRGNNYFMDMTELSVRGEPA